MEGILEKCEAGRKEFILKSVGLFLVWNDIT